MATDMINSLKIGSDVHVLSLPYGTCTTSAGTTAKTVSVDNFSLETGAHVSIKFNNANTATSPTLNVNSTGAKTIYYRGAALTTASLAKQLQGIIEFVYNGTQWEIVGNLDTDTNTKSFTITANASDDDVVVLSGTNGSNAVTYSASHAKKGPSSGYTSGNTTTSISGSGGSGTIKIPQITVDAYGHVTAGADENVTITLPTIPGLSETPSTDTSTIKPTGSAKSKTFTAITALGTNNHTITDTTTTYTLDLSEFATTAEISTAMVFKGSLGTNGTITSLPTAAAALVGDTYKVITAGTYANIAAKVGDVFVCPSKPEWVLIPSGDEPSGTVTSIATSGDIQGDTITTSGTISHKASGVTAASYGPSANTTPSPGGTFSVPYFTVNANGHVTAASTKTITMPSDITITTTGSGNAITAASFSNRTLTLTRGATFNNFSLPTRLAEYQASSGVVNNPDAATKTGFYYVKGSTNSPAWSQTDKNSSGQTQTSDDYRILTTAHSDEWLQQIATDFRSSDIYFRRRTQYGGWTGWRKFAMKDEVPTKVSQLTNDSGFSTLTLGTTSTTAAKGDHTHKYAGSSSAGGAATSANKVNKALTFNNGGQGVASGTTFDGSTARTISYNTIGAAAASHKHTKAEITDFPSSLPANGGNADSADYADSAGYADRADYADSAGYADRADYADSAGYAISADNAASANHAEEANYAQQASNADQATNATYSIRADYPKGFASNGGSISWGTLRYTDANGYQTVARWDSPNGGSVGFADGPMNDATKKGQTSMQIDGFFYQDEGNYMLVDNRNLENRSDGSWGNYLHAKTRLVVAGNGGSYNEGIRILPASNGWSNMYFSADSTLSSCQPGGWLVGRRGAAGDKAGAIGDFTIEENGSDGSGLTLHKNTRNSSGAITSYGGATLKGNFTASGQISAGTLLTTPQGIRITQTDGANGYGISLYGSASPQTYGLWFGKTASWGTHGSVTSDWATYFGMNSGATTRGWIFRREDGCVASISGSGNLTVNGHIKLGNAVTLQYNSTNQCVNFVF